MKREEIIKVINSEAKMNILRELSKGQKTPTDLSRKLGKVKSTIVEHLDELVRLGLVAKIEEEGRKWVFYSLTKDGYRVLEGRPKIYELILPSSVLSLVIGLLILIRKEPTQKVYAVSESVKSNINIVPFILIGIGVLGLIFYIIKVKRNG
ncbi:MAG: winged helix-turn-helix domain-containing protein [Candidatus Aenigmatarchaeota archaeon]|nr:winged helix-turn-helix domain-containing protein [Candidatus Aenigmarchaeota archaeon]